MGGTRVATFDVQVYTPQKLLVEPRMYPAASVFDQPRRAQIMRILKITRLLKAVKIVEWVDLAPLFFSLSLSLFLFLFLSLSLSLSPSPVSLPPSPPHYSSFLTYLPFTQYSSLHTIKKTCICQRNSMLSPAAEPTENRFHPIIPRIRLPACLKQQTVKERK
jgi:hypothetical protein